MLLALVRTNGVNTNGVAAKVMFVAGLEQLYDLACLGHEVVLNATFAPFREDLQGRHLLPRVGARGQVGHHAVQGDDHGDLVYD